MKGQKLPHRPKLRRDRQSAAIIVVDSVIKVYRGRAPGRPRAKPPLLYTLFRILFGGEIIEI